MYWVWKDICWNDNLKMLKALRGRVDPWSAVDLLCPIGCWGTLIFWSWPFVEEVEEGVGVEETSLRGAGVGGINAFFGAFCSSSMENQIHTMIHCHEKISNDHCHVARKEKNTPIASFWEAKIRRSDLPGSGTGGDSSFSSSSTVWTQTLVSNNNVKNEVTPVYVCKTESKW